MIREIWSDRPSFKRLKFKTGLNIIVADRKDTKGKSKDSGNKRSRNGSGKSSFVDIVHFVFGGNVDKRTVISSSALRDDTFGLTLDLFGSTVRASRSPSRRTRIIVDGDTRAWPIRPEVDEDTGVSSFSIDTWKDLLGRAFFGLPASQEIRKGSYLSFRLCFPYFARRAHDGGFQDWTKTMAGQRAVAIAVNLSYLIGLDPDIAFGLHDIKRREDVNRELGKSIKEGFLKDAVGSTSDIRKALRKAESAGHKLQQRLASKNIVDFYSEHENEANRLQREIDDINDSSLLDHDYLEDLRAAVKDEEAPDVPQLEQLYKSIGISLPSIALKKYDDVHKFHVDVIANRKSHLSAEIDSTMRRIDERSERREKLARRLDDISGLLKSGMAKSHYERIQRQLIDAESDIKELRQRLKVAQLFESNKAKLKVEKAEAQLALSRDHQERSDLIAEAMETFDEVSSRMYEHPASLSIVYDNYATRYQIQKDDLKSEGVSNMQIFSFDLMLAVLGAKRGKWPGFLIHDSHLFDGVDGRQVGVALRVAEQVLSSHDGQYIISMNSDDLAKVEKESEEDFSGAIVKPMLDDTEDGGLFGFHFSYGEILEDSIGDDESTETDSQA